MTSFQPRWFVILCVTACSAVSQSPSVETRLSKDTIEIGERTDYSVAVRHLKSQVILGDPIVDFHDFEVVQIRKYEPEKSGEEMIDRWQYTITTFRVDTFEILPPRVALVTSSRDTTVMEGMARRLIVSSALDTSIKDIQPEKPMIAGKVNWWLLALYILLILSGVGAIIFMIHRWWSRRKKGEVPVPAPVVIRRPEEIALEELDIIKSKRLVEKGEYKLFNTEVSNVVRSYIEKKFNMLALEMPTSELMRHFHQRGVLDSSQFSTLRALLEVADLVKFAKYKPNSDECEDVLERAVQFVIRTSTPETKPETVVS